MQPNQANLDLTSNHGRTLQARRYLSAVAQRLPAMQHALENHGHLGLQDYVRSLSPPRMERALQDHQDLVHSVYRHCEQLLGEDIARRAANSLAANATVLTANHHGVDFFAQSVQGTIALSLGADSHDGAVVVLACGAVPLNNLTYPRGMLAYLETDTDAALGPNKLPVFSDRFKRSLVCTTPAMDAAMVDRARKRLHKMQASERIAASIVPTMDMILEQDYAAPEVLSLATYSEQSTVLNQRIWKRMLKGSTSAPTLAYLELEAVSIDLITADLATDSSLAWAVLFEPELREQVLSLLDGERACWSRAALARRNLATGSERSAAGATGTVFFWGLDSSHRRVPLALTTDTQGVTHLQGVADDGEQIRVHFNPPSVAEALGAGRLLPSLFMSYLSIAMARGVTCLGGYYQAQYLPTMQNAVVDALEQTWGAHDMARRVASATTDAYLSGMQAVCTRNRAGGLIPAGPLEIIAGGALDDADLKKISEIPVADAHLASIVDTLMDAGRDLVGDGPWNVELARELAAAVETTVVVKGV